MKAGTTAARENLRKHPSIYMEKGETHWFDHHGKNGINGYHTHFPAHKISNQVKAIGDCTPNYALLPSVAPSIHKYFPAAKIIFLVRNPVTRAFSHYAQLVRNLRRDNKAVTFASQVQKDMKDVPKHPPVTGNMLSRGFYADQLERYSKLFDRSQILVLCSESLQKSHNYTALLNFIGVEPIELEAADSHVANKYPEVLDDATRETLHRYYEPHNTRLIDWFRGGPDFGNSNYSQELVQCVQAWEKSNIKSSILQ